MGFVQNIPSTLSADLRRIEMAIRAGKLTILSTLLQKTEATLDPMKKKIVRTNNGQEKLIFKK